MERWEPEEIFTGSAEAFLIFVKTRRRFIITYVWMGNTIRTSQPVPQRTLLMGAAWNRHPFLNKLGNCCLNKVKLISWLHDFFNILWCFVNIQEGIGNATFTKSIWPQKPYWHPWPSLFSKTSMFSKTLSEKQWSKAELSSTAATSHTWLLSPWNVALQLRNWNFNLIPF